MPDWAQIISDALDILKFDGAVQDTLAELRAAFISSNRGGEIILLFRIWSLKKTERFITV